MLRKLHGLNQIKKIKKIEIKISKNINIDFKYLVIL